jgi:hypothetical protein
MSNADHGKRYRIVLRGRLGERFADAFDGMSLSSRRGETVLEGRLSDQSQLFGVLDRVRDLAIDVVRVEELSA